MNDQIKNPEHESVDIPLTIYTEYTTDNKADRLRMQVEQTCFHIGAIAYFMKLAARGHSLLDLQTDSVLLDLANFTANVELCCQLIEALSNSIELPLIRLEDAYKAEKPPAAADSIKDAPDSLLTDADDLAAQISSILNNPNLPKRLYDGLRTAIVDAENEEIDQSEILKFQDKSEYIAMILRGFPKGETEK